MPVQRLLKILAYAFFVENLGESILFGLLLQQAPLLGFVKTFRLYIVNQVVDFHRQPADLVLTFHGNPEGIVLGFPDVRQRGGYAFYRMDNAFGNKGADPECQNGTQGYHEKSQNIVYIFLGQEIIHADSQQNPPVCVFYIGIIGDIALSTYLILKISLRIFNKINALVIFYIVLAFGSRCDKIIPAFLRRSGAYDLLPAIQKVEGGIIPERGPFPDAFVEIQIDFHEGITESLPLFINSCNSHKGFVALTVNQDI